MTTIQIRFGEEACEALLYEAAGVRLASDRPLAALEVWRSRDDGRVPLPAVEPCEAHETGAEPQEIFGTLGGRQRRVRVWHQSGASRIRVDDRQDVVVSRGAIRVPGGGTIDPDLEEILLGPALVTALAHEGTFCVHASAVEARGRACMLLADSGWGKSTLADARRAGWRRLADDVLPTRIDDASLVALPRFPQLKLAIELQYPADAPPVVTIDRWYVLDPRRDFPDAPRVTPLAGAEAAAALMSGIVAARVLSPELQERALRFVSHAVSRVAGAKLTYGWGLDRLEEVRDSIGM